MTVLVNMWNGIELNPTPSDCVHLLIHKKEFELDSKLIKHCETSVRLMKQQELTEFVESFDVSGVMLKNEQLLKILPTKFVQHLKETEKQRKNMSTAIEKSPMFQQLFKMVNKVTADNENLKKDHEKVMKDNENLMKDHEKVMKDNENLKKDNENLRKDNEKVMKDNEKVMKDNDKLMKDNEK